LKVAIGPAPIHAAAFRGRELPRWLNHRTMLIEALLLDFLYLPLGVFSLTLGSSCVYHCYTHEGDCHHDRDYGTGALNGTGVHVQPVSYHQSLRCEVLATRHVADAA